MLETSEWLKEIHALQAEIKAGNAARAESSAQWAKWQEEHDKVKARLIKAEHERDEAHRLLATLTKQYEDLLNRPSVEIPLNKVRVADLLVCALEGGSNYWYTIEEFVEPTKLQPVYGKDTFRHIDYPLNDGGAIVVSDRRQGGKTEARIDWTRIQQGLKIMSTKYPSHFAAWLAENEDADTGDVFLQCCVFGELVYG